MGYRISSRFCTISLWAAASTTTNTTRARAFTAFSAGQRQGFPSHFLLSKKKELLHTRFSPSPTSRMQSSVASTEESGRNEMNAHLSDDEVRKITMDWVERIIVGWNLCPFAHKPFREEEIWLDIVRGDDPEEIMGAVFADAVMLTTNPGTFLIVAPECRPHDFSRYMTFVDTLEKEVFPKCRETDEIQMAPFHPLFQFGDEGETRSSPYTNRSPFPIFHLIKEAHVTKAVDILEGDASLVWKRNVALMEDLQRQLGSEEDLRRVIRDASQMKTLPETREKVEKALERHKLKLKPVKDSFD